MECHIKLVIDSDYLHLESNSIILRIVSLLYNIRIKIMLNRCFREQNTKIVYKLNYSDPFLTIILKSFLILSAFP